MIAAIYNKADRYRRFLRVTPFDQTTEQGERDERYRLAILSSATMVMMRLVSLLAGLFTVYVAAPSLGAERFGAWNAIISYFSLAIIFDFGIPSALVNRIAHARHQTHQELTRAISSAIITLMALGLIASAFWMITAWLLPWSVALNSQNNVLLEETQQSALLAAPILMIQFLNSGLSNIVLGLQRGFVTNVATFFVNILIIPATLLAKYYAPTPAGFIWATQGVGLMTCCIIILYLWSARLLTIPNSVQHALSEFRSLWLASRSYYIVNIIFVFTTNLDLILASSLLDPNAVSELALVQRLFQIFIGVSTVLTTPLWSAYADAMAKHDHYFVRQTLFRSINASIALILVCIPVTVVYSSTIFHVWTNGVIQPNTFLVLVVSISAALGIVFTTFGFYLNGCALMRPQITANILHAPIAFVLKVVMTIYLGVEGIALAGIVAALIAYGIAYGVIHRREIFNPLKSHTSSLN